jgi:acetate kinase
MGAGTSFVLTVNSGSSSIKFGLFTCDAQPKRQMAGAITGIGTPAATLTSDLDRGGSGALGNDGADHVSAARHLIAWLAPHLAQRAPAAVVHRLVHGGERFHKATRITPGVLRALRELIPLAPNHLPDELALIEAFGREQPTTTQVACFDTAFHHDLPEVSHTLPVPAQPGMRRYGFHGLSYGYLLGQLADMAGTDAARGRVVMAHLGNGASLAAVRGGRCMDTSMGLTPAGGLVMSTRTGDIDPGVIVHLARRERLSIDAMDEVLTKQSGLLGIASRTGDMQRLLAMEGSDRAARLAVDVFCYQLRKWIGAFAAALGGLDTLIFSGGIGEHAPRVRERACSPLDFLGVRLDPDRNASNAPVISADDAAVIVRVIPTDESLMMAREAYAVVSTASDP